MKICYFCKGPVARGRVDYMVKRAGSYTLIKDLPIESCGQCGETYLDEAASKQIDLALSNSTNSSEHLDIPVVRCS